MDGAIDRTLRQAWAFVFRGYHLTRRYISWVIVFNFYALTGSAAVALIGVAAHDHRLTLTLVVGSLLLVSGVYYPVEVLPAWIQPISALSPATYTLAACRRLVGVGDPATTPHRLAGAPLATVVPELVVLLVMGAALVPLGLWVFGRVER